jgi:hypothetical protein
VRLSEIADQALLDHLKASFPTARIVHAFASTGAGVGFLKVHPEEVEAIINLHPREHMSLVKARRNPVTGAIIVADVVLPLSSSSRRVGRPGSQ